MRILQLNGLLQVIKIYDNGSQDHLSCFLNPWIQMKNGYLAIKMGYLAIKMRLDLVKVPLREIF